ncbi:MAG: NAD/NADP octopine/nopaline dehydrogenase family protein [Candidatus Heimdallarchaeota archaeon]|nr:NAD/NADP octopine/nopaline dehydrogenase family protein [Candidatus Heimdallarchaeota archaeon]MCK4769645.1 NAD/NADP octopine/nopaline dehydrogenase family protein [Candidatus Heimdallarchaeota archaeon]
MNIAVLGAGCGGQAIAGFLASKGNKVNLYNRSPERIRLLLNKKEIQLQGEIQAVGELNLVTTDISKAVYETDLIMVVTTATGHCDIAKALAPCLQRGQTIVLNPGRTFGSLEFMKTLIDGGLEVDVNVAEANTLIYATRIIRPGLSEIKGIKKTISLSVLPNHRTSYVVSLLNENYPQFYAVDNFLITSLGNIGAVFHPTITLLNRERIKKKETFDFYREGATREVVEYMEQVDYERRNIARKFGVEVQSLRDWLCERYGLQEDNLYDALHQNPYYRGLSAPKSFDMRYLTEDIPTGLVPFSELAKTVGVDTSHIDKLINIASKELSIDFRYEGRNLHRLGLNVETIFEDLEKITEFETIKDYRIAYGET